MTRPKHWSIHDEAKAQRIASDLENLIKQGFYPSGETIPGEHQLGRIYGAGSHTAARIRELLKSENLVRVVKGKGTFVL